MGQWSRIGGEMMDDPDRRRLQVALGIISGRLTEERIGVAELEYLGYDTFKIGYYGRPSMDDLKTRAEECLLGALE